MQWQTNPYFAPIIISSLIAIVCAFFVITRRNRASGSTALLGLIFSVIIWGFAYAMELASVSLKWQIFWAKVEYLGIPFVPLFFFIFAYQFTQSTSKLSRRVIFFLVVISSIFVLLAWTNEFHNLIWTELGKKNIDGYYMLTLGHGMAFWLLITYSYILLAIASISIIRRALSGPAEIRKQTYIILVGASVTWLGNIIYISGLSPVPELDLTPIGFVISSVIFSFGIFGYGMLDIMPIAGEFILESLDDVVIVTNPKGMLIYVNRAFEYYFSNPVQSLIGRQATEAFSNLPVLKSLFDSSNTIRREITVTPENRPLFIFNVRTFNIRLSANEVIGRVTILNDITERRAAENRLSQQSLEAGSGDLPLMVMYRVSDDKIVDVNRTFLINLGYERKDVLGRTLMGVQFWGVNQRADFLRMLYKNGSLKDYAFEIGKNGQKYILSASQIEMQDTKYIVIFAQEDWSGS